MKTSIYLAGEFLETSNKIEVINPHNGTKIADCSLANSTHIETAIQKAIQVRKAMTALPTWKKSIILKNISDSIVSFRRRFAEIIALEGAKPLCYALTEVDRAAETFLIASEESKRIPHETIQLDTTPGSLHKFGRIEYFPCGIIAGISPFNFPLNLVAHKIAPAIASGCPIILKPSSLTPLTALMLAGIIDQTELPDGALSILPCTRETGNLLVTDNRVALLSFTGSPKVGWELKKESGNKKIVLELGGNAGVYIHSDADIEKAVEKCVKGAFAYSGQTCIHTQRIYVHVSLFDHFLKAFIEQTKLLIKGDPLDKATDIAEMIDEKNAIRVEKWIEEDRKNGLQILMGGKRNKNYFEPTVVTGSSTNHFVNANEVFAPVVCVEKVKNYEDGIYELNNTRFGLQSGIFTNDFSLIQQAFNELQVGGVIVNDIPGYRNDAMPYGGIKDSGLGREGVKYAMREFMEARVLVI